MRKRINKAAICSSENYESRHKMHLDFLKKEHQENIVILEEITRVKKAYVRVFGKLIPLTEQEVKTTTLKITWI